MNLIKKIVELSLGIIIYWISCLIPRSKSIWVFGAWFGQNYSDNSKYLFEFLNENNKEINPVWITKNNSVINFLSQQGFKVYLNKSLMGVYYMLRAKIGIISSGVDDLNKYLLGNMSIIQLWHGIPLKKIMYDDQINQKRSILSKLYKIILPFNNNKFQMLIATSEEVQTKLSKAFKVKKELVKITGFPRNDALFKEAVNYPLKEEIKRLKGIGRKVGIYLPTFRDSNGDKFTERIINDFNKLDQNLSEMNCVVFVKMHFIHQTYFEQKELQYINIYIIKDIDIYSDIYNVLPYTDFLITDYSSIFFDYLLLKKPIIFYPFDYHDYIKNNRELYYEYSNVTPGDKVYSIDELVIGIKRALTNSDMYLSSRDDITQKFHANVDGNYCKKTFNEISNLYK